MATAASDPPLPLNREQVRSRRKREVRAKTISVKRMTKREIEIGRLFYPESVEGRPTTRGECANGQRPCPFAGCKYHLAIDISASTGAIKLNFPDLEVWELAETCALDVADRGGETLENVAALTNITRERVRQIETKALARMARAGAMERLRDHADEGEHGRRRLPVLQGAP